MTIERHASMRATRKASTQQLNRMKLAVQIEIEVDIVMALWPTQKDRFLPFWPRITRFNPNLFIETRRVN